MRIDQRLQTGKFFNYKGHQIFYRSRGTGEALFLIHGFPTSGRDWHKIEAQLAEKFTLYILDMIGFGLSDKPKNYGYSLTDQADLWEVFAEKNGIERAHILAHDYGDTVAQELIARHIMHRRERVQSLDIQSVALLNGGILQGGYRPRFIQKMLASPVGGYLHPFIGKASLRRTFNNIFGKNKATAEEIDDYWEEINYKQGKRVIPKIIQYLHERKKKQTRWENALVNCPVPLLLINGTQDPISGQNIVDLFRKKVPNGEVVELPESGHYPQSEQPEEVLAAYLSWVGRLRS